MTSSTAGGTPYKQKRITNLSSSQHRIADMTFITVYPEGTNNTDWNMTHIWQGAPYENTTVDDIQLARDIIETVSTNYSIDHSRIYASGKSNGGGFTALLACLPETSEVFAAFAPVSPALYPGTRAFYNCSPSRPIPLLHVHGLEDPITPFYGVEKGWFGNEPDVRIWRAQWAERNGCRSKLGYTLPVPDDVQVKGNATVERWGCQEEVVAISVEGLGHSWPSREGRDTSGSPWHEADFDLTEDYLLDFFSSHRLDHGP